MTSNEPGYTDGVTRLHNGRYFRERLLKEKRNVDQSSSGCFALLVIDLDGFKSVNDTHGRTVGDKVLVQAGKLLKGNLKSSDIVCRYRGDEFAIILPGVSEDDMARVAKRIVQRLAEASWIGAEGQPIQPVTCSLGYTVCSTKGMDPSELMAFARERLYCAKRRGGSRACGDNDLFRECPGRPLNTASGIAGREDELARLNAFLEGSRKHGLLVISGEPGIGKTRLLREFRRLFEANKGAALIGECHGERPGRPYHAFWKAFEYFARKNPDESVLSPDEMLEHLQKNLAAVKERPLLFAVEDLQWADDASLNFLNDLARHLAEEKVLLCATCRMEEASGGDGSGFLRFLESLRADDLLEEMALGPLSPKDVSHMVNLLLPGARSTDEFKAFVHRKSGGNPLFVEEILKFMTEEEIVRGLPPVREVPQSVQGLLRIRVNLLAAGVRDILARGALVGEEFGLEVLRKTADHPGEAVLRAVKTGERANIIIELMDTVDQQYRFAHPLIREILCADTNHL
jgi:diguanylate cyclase (GGDEF)-like protein